jgi:hypothetical protein
VVVQASPAMPAGLSIPKNLEKYVPGTGEIPGFSCETTV